MRRRAWNPVIALGSLAVAAVLWWAFAIERAESVGDAVGGDPARGEPRGAAEVVAAPPARAEEGGSARREAATENAEPTHRIVGRVVDERRRPVSGVAVACTVLEEEGGSSDAASSSTAAGGAGGEAAGLVRARTDDEGRFALRVAVVAGARSACVVARDGAGRAATKGVALPEGRVGDPAEVDAGTLVLEPAYRLRVRVVEEGRAAAGARVEWSLGHRRERAGAARANERGELVIEALPEGPVYLEARSGDETRREGRARAWVPETGEVVIELEPLGAAEVLVVDAESGEGVPGARIEVREDFRVPASVSGNDRGLTSGEFVASRLRPDLARTTDAEGRARIEGLVRGVRYRASVRAEGYAPFPRPPTPAARLEPDGEPVRIEIAPIPTRTVRWPLVAGEVPPPPEGSAITLRHVPGVHPRGDEPPVPAPGRVRGGMLVVEDVPGTAFYFAEAPDGSLARLWVREGEDVGPEVSFRRPRRVEVLVREGSGVPIAGASVLAKTQGNNPIGDPVATGADGRAVLEGLYGGLVEIAVAEPGADARWAPSRGTVNLDDGDARLEVTLVRPKPVRARLRLFVDGVPALPPGSVCARAVRSRSCARIPLAASSSSTCGPPRTHGWRPSS